MIAPTYRAGRLSFGEVPLETIAETYGTPCYVYSADIMRARLEGLQDALAGLGVLVCYAVKANHHLAIIRTLALAGAGADAVSKGEIMRARAAGVPAERIVFAGVGKTAEEISYALAEGVLQINVESKEELERVAAIAGAMGLVAPIGLRVNPDVAAATHDKISTGRKGDKFGIAIGEAPAAYAMARAHANLDPVAVHIHIGSQITDARSFAPAYERVADLARGLLADGVPLRRIDLGGGFGVSYDGGPEFDPATLAALIRRTRADLDLGIVLEPGRYLVADAGVVLATVIYVKPEGSRTFVILDAGMQTLIRPAMYGARHAIMPLAEPRGSQAAFDVAGPICESSDLFGRDYTLPEVRSGDRVAILGAGAYGSVMSSSYNSRVGAAEVLVDGARTAVITRRREPEELFDNDIVPAWLRAGSGDAA